MLILDNLLISPLMWILKEIDAAAQKEQAGEAESVTRSLGELHMQLEAGNITEAEFDATEAILLDRLDAIRERDGDPEEEEDEDVNEADSRSPIEVRG